MKIRKKIRRSGSYSDKIIGLTDIPYATIGWYLIYHIRGQNEGINGIMKKRGNLIGDGQKTTWNTGLMKVNNRIQSKNAFIKTSAYIKFIITGEKSHHMCRIYNWVSQLLFIKFFFRRLCRVAPQVYYLWSLFS